MSLDIKKIVSGATKAIGHIAPTIVKALPGGQVLGPLLDALGISGNSEDEILSQLENLSPEQLDILKKHEQIMESYEVQKREQDLQNVQSARRDTKDISFNSPHFAIAALIVVLFVVVAVGIIFFTDQMDPEAEKFVFYVLGILSNETARVLNFFYGSSLGSKRKTDAMLNDNR